MAEPRWWLRQIQAEERNTLFATFAGWMLDGMDVMVYSFVLPSLILLWHISRAQAGWLSTAALLLSSVGGWAAGVAADRWGRVRILQITILWFAFFTFLSGFTSSLGQLAVVRGLQGLGFGGEWAVGSVLIGERIRGEFRGRAVGTTQAGWAIGWGAAAVFYALFFRLLPAYLAWRAMFWIGILPAFLVFWIQRNVHEPEVFQRARRARASAAGLVQIFKPPLLPTTALASLLALGAQGGYYAVTTFLPLYLNARGLSTTATGAYLMVVIGGSFAGYLVSAHLADRLGRRGALVLFAAGSFAAIAFYMFLPFGDLGRVAMGFPLGFFPSGAFSPMGSYFTELFPTWLRGSGQGFSYNFGRAGGALFPTLVGYFSAQLGLGWAIGLFAASAYALMAAAALALPETRNRDLAEIAVEGGL